MVGYLSETAFVGKLSFDIIMWIVILLITFYCIRRYPTDYYTNYRKRNRIILGSLCFLAALGFLFLGFMLPEDFAIRNYFLSTFGTYTPNEIMIQLGMSPTVSPRAVGVTPIFALPTYEQWLILQKINSFAVTFALGIIFFYFKKSSTRTLAKVRKVCGYIFLIFLVPAALNIHLYFDLEEFIVTIPICIITWFLLRTYRKDFLEPTLPVESVQHGDNKDFAPIATEVIHSIENTSTSKISTKLTLLTSKINKMKSYNKQVSSSAANTIILLIVTALLAISFLVFNSYRGYYIDENYKKEWSYQSEYDVWCKEGWHNQTYIGVNHSLGTPMRKGTSLYYQDYWKSNDNNLVGYKELPQYYRLLSYVIDDSANYISKQIVRLKQQNVVWKNNVYIDQYGESRNQLVFWDSADKSFYFEYNGRRVYAPYWSRKHILEVSRNKAYEFIAYYPCGYSDSYDNSFEENYSLDNPNRMFLFKLKKMTILLWIFMLMTCLSGIVFIVLLTKKIKQEQIKNIRAYKLLMYQLILTIIEFVTFAIIVLTSADYKFYYETNIVRILIYGTTLLFVKVPLLLYVYKKIKKEDNLYYLFPQWLMNFINRYTSSEAALRAVLILIIFPLFYLSTLPFGIFVLAYLIPAVIIYMLVFFIVWIIKGTTQEINKYQCH